MYSVISGAKAANTSFKGYGYPSNCDDETLSQTKVKGKIVYCAGDETKDRSQDWIIEKLGGAGVIMNTNSIPENVNPYIIPASLVPSTDGTKIDRYINTTKNAKIVIYKSTTVPTIAPFVASFSSRGPQRVSQHILKPDIAAPGLNILAAYTPFVTLSGESEDKRIVKYNILSGTSMACPHVSGAAIYVKSFHPTWSPAAIKSALMTTATPMKINQPEAEFGYGSGQINPTKALNPGLIYDINQSSYIRFLCKEGYNSTTIRLLTGGKKLHKCSTFGPPQGSDGLNYPSMQLTVIRPNNTINAIFYRTVTNVGPAKSVYNAKVRSPKGVSVKVVPSTLSFGKKLEKRSFRVVLKGKFMERNEWFLSSMLEWSDGRHKVSSPIVVLIAGDYD